MCAKLYLPVASSASRVRQRELGEEIQELLDQPSASALRGRRGPPEHPRRGQPTKQPQEQSPPPSPGEGVGNAFWAAVRAAPGGAAPGGPGRPRGTAPSKGFGDGQGKASASSAFDSECSQESRGSGYGDESDDEYRAL